MRGFVHEIKNKKIPNHLYYKSDDSRVNAVLFGMRLSVVPVAPDIY